MVRAEALEIEQNGHFRKLREEIPIAAILVRRFDCFSADAWGFQWRVQEVRLGAAPAKRFSFLFRLGKKQFGVDAQDRKV